MLKFLLTTIPEPDLLNLMNNMKASSTKSKIKSLTSIADISAKDLAEIILLTKELKENPLKRSSAIQNQSIALIFAKPSLRTRISFEVGIRQLGGHPITIKMDEISVGIRENVEDIGKVLSKYVSSIVIRTFEQREVEDLEKYSSVPVINGLSDEEHPCQVISDIFTISETFKSTDNLKVAYVGDGNNVAQSLLLACALSNINISISSPKNYQIKEKYIELAKQLNQKINIEITEDPMVSVKDADVLYTDVWTSMGQEKEAEKRRKIFMPYQINDELLSRAKNNAIVLHCLPAHKGEEISHDVFDRFSETIYKQAENRLHAQKAIILKLMRIN